ncbi:MAG: hypothetical protein NTW87_14030 [Planctomycetota bacterium]|nr:hypothetical protein [Planctomycetota bacterium]
MEGIWIGTITSNEVAITMKPAAGKDVDAVTLMKVAAANGRVSMATALRDREVSSAIVTLTKSERFRPVAQFYYGMAHFRILDGPGGGGVTVEGMAEAGGSFDECAQRTDNQYLKSLARYYSVRTRAFDPDTLPYEQAEKMVAEILKEHAGTYAAWKAPEVLEKLKAAQKKK